MLNALKRTLRAWLEVPDAPAAPAQKTVHPGRISDEAISRARAAGAPPQVRFEFKPPELPPGVVPKNAATMAMDDHPYLALDDANIVPFYQYANYLNNGLGFPGYPYLAEKARISEYRNPSETISTEMTRRWIKFKTTGKEDRSEQIEQIQKLFNDLNVRDCFRRAALQVGFFGRSQIFPIIKGQESDASRELPLIIDPETIPRDSFTGMQVIEPYWVTPFWYNTTDPTDPDFFSPRWWFVLGKKVHSSRMLIFIGHELPDLFKPAYNFSGMSITQLMQPDVLQWLRTRDSVSDTVFNFSTTVLKTNMQGTLSGDSGDEMLKRAQLFNATKSNQGLMLLDKDTEELEKVTTSLAGLDELQAQAQEHMAAPSKMPLVKLTGITPSGLNASSDGEIQVWYDHVKSMQEEWFRKNLKATLTLAQCSLFGQIFDDIDFEFEPLTELDGEALARVRKSDAEGAIAYIQEGVIDPAEERERLAMDPNSAYTNLDPDKVIEPPVDPMENAPGLSMAGGEDE